MPSLDNFYDTNNKGRSFSAVVCLICLAVSFQDSILRYVKEFRLLSGEACYNIWLAIYQLFAGDDKLLFLFATPLMGLVLFISCNAFFAFLDLTGKPQVLMKYKIQDNKNVPVDWVKYKKCLKQVAFNSTIVGGTLQLVIWPIWRQRGVATSPEALPSIQYLVLQLLLFVTVEEILFYSFHRLFHCSFLYKRIHKIHHEWTSPVAIASSYCHPIEHFVVNLLPIHMGPLLLGPHLQNHLVSFWIWLGISIIVTTVHHSGYHIPFLVSSEGHDYHHSKFNQMYGVVGVLDYLLGTDSSFRCSVELKRHFVLLGRASAKEIIPDT